MKPTLLAAQLVGAWKKCSDRINRMYPDPLLVPAIALGLLGDPYYVRGLGRTAVHALARTGQLTGA